MIYCLCMEIKTINIFSFIEYKKFLTAVFKLNNKIRGMYKMMAAAANCQASYISQVMRRGSKVQLTPEQAFGVSQFFLLSPKERDYFLLLVDLERAAPGPLKKLLTEKVKSIQSNALEIGNILERPMIENKEELVRFFSTWMYSYIHILTSIPEYQSTEAISKKVNISVDSVLSILSDLENMNYIQRENGLWKYSGKLGHIDAKSRFIGNHHNNWRQQALLDVQLNPSPESVHFTGVYSISSSDYVKIRSCVLECLKEVNSIALSSGTEEVIIFCCDFFKK
ncbi:MAG: TIGR02147 family protein [Deltaproteobacteria bacterium]|jgi:uncharacterized protein (TIGR02147 family)|nr:TIGR02147 family protein [Deltaproteobacteria bacterium]